LKVTRPLPPPDERPVALLPLASDIEEEKEKHKEFSCAQCNLPIKGTKWICANW